MKSYHFHLYFLWLRLEVTFLNISFLFCHSFCFCTFIRENLADHREKTTFHSYSCSIHGNVWGFNIIFSSFSQQMSIFFLCVHTCKHNVHVWVRLWNVLRAVCAGFRESNQYKSTHPISENPKLPLKTQTCRNVHFFHSATDGQPAWFCSPLAVPSTNSKLEGDISAL